MAHTENSHSAAIANREKLKILWNSVPSRGHHILKKEIEFLKIFPDHISKAKADWTMQSFVEFSMKDSEIRSAMKSIVCISGGIDSTTLAVLLNTARKG